ncbi:MAG: flagellar hook-length control protein FliK [Lachnospiraceae bacterium]|nr:flagellar hook-length control protein FliK [Lachnospiraceae bacterium]
MGSTSVKDVGNLLGGLSIGAQSMMMGKISTDAKSASPGFKSFLSAGEMNAEKDTPQIKTAAMDKNPAGKGEDTSDRIAGEDKADAGKTTAADKKQDTKTEDADMTNGKQVKGQGLSEKSEKAVTGDETEITVALEEAAATLLNQIIEILDITPEEAENIMDDMSIENTELLDPETLSAFALRAMGEEDSLSLLTNETQFEQFQNINLALKEVLSSESPFEGIDISELKNIAAGEIEIADDAIPAKEIIPEEAFKPEEVREEVKPVKQQGDKEIASELEQVEVTSGNTLGARALLKNSSSHFEGRGNEGNRGELYSGMNFAQQLVTEVNTPLEADFAGQIREAVSPQEIANQIMDYMRSQVKPDMQTLEMQLHPASLGNIQINLVHKDGAVTANFIAADEQVRAVLENQMIQLQERFEEQGIKVNSIEVSVGAQLSDQNLSEGNGGSKESESKEKNKVRKINFASDFNDENLEELEDDERIAAEMMAANGQTMDARA